MGYATEFKVFESHRDWLRRKASEMRRIGQSELAEHYEACAVLCEQHDTEVRIKNDNTV